MRDTIKDLNKASIAAATGISYSRLRKFSTGVVETLTPQEIEKIREYLMALANKFKIN